jgi:hypothetical protein
VSAETCAAVCGTRCFVSYWEADRKCSFCIVANCAMIIPHNLREDEGNCVSKVIVNILCRGDCDIQWYSVCALLFIPC